MLYFFSGKKRHCYGKGLYSTMISIQIVLDFPVDGHVLRISNDWVKVDLLKLHRESSGGIEMKFL